MTTQCTLKGETLLGRSIIVGSFGRYNFHPYDQRKDVDAHIVKVWRGNKQRMRPGKTEFWVTKAEAKFLEESQHPKLNVDTRW